MAHVHHLADDDGLRGAAHAPQLLQALRSVLAPLARLAVARGVTHRDIDDLLKSLFIESAREAHPGVAAHRSVSRVSVATGIDRREVTRLTQPATAAAPRQSPANELFTRWLSDPRFRSRGRPMARLRRLGEHPSFQSLAESVSRDVKPRAYLEELCRLGLARVDEHDDVVVLLRDRFVPSADDAQMLGFLGDNVGDHLAAAVANVVARAPEHLEQALFADELSAHSIESVRPLVESEWKGLVQRLAPRLQALIDDDRAAGRTPEQRLRIGLYAFTARMADAAASTGSASIPTSAKSRRST